MQAAGQCAVCVVLPSDEAKRGRRWRNIGSGHLRMVECVEGIDPKRYDEPFPYHEVLQSREVEVVCRIGTQQVQREGAVIPRARLVSRYFIEHRGIEGGPRRHVRVEIEVVKVARVIDVAP